MVFSDNVDIGNPMVVVQLSHWLSDDILVAIAAKLPSEEVTFLCRTARGVRLRWFGPRGEVPLCGHGALAAAAVMADDLRLAPCVAEAGPESLPLLLQYVDDVAAVGMQPAKLIELEPNSIDIGVPIVKLFDTGRDFLALLPNEHAVRDYVPNRACLLSLAKLGLIVSAKSESSGSVFRFFAPRAGLPEDRASVSVIPALVRYWFVPGQTREGFIQCSGRDVAINAEECNGRILVSGAVFLHNCTSLRKTGLGVLARAN